MAIYWDKGQKIFEYGDHAVIIDFERHTKETRWLCGCCGRYAAINHGTWSQCLYCASKKV